MNVRFRRSSPYVLAVAWLALTACAVPAVFAFDGSSTATCFAIDASGSNSEPDGGYPASDPGPRPVRAAVVQLYDVLVGANATGTSLVGYVTFGTTVTDTMPFVDVANGADRAALNERLGRALRPSGSTSTVSGIEACSRMLQQAPAGVTRRIVLLSDGLPQGPDGTAARQVAVLRDRVLPAARRAGISTSTVLYGGAAGEASGPAVATMSSIADAGGGRSYRAPGGLELLHVAVSLAAGTVGLQTTGIEASVSGTTTVPLPISAAIERASIVVVRSSPDVQISVSGPGGDVITTSSAPSATTAIDAYSLVLTLDGPVQGTYAVGAVGVGAIYATELVRAFPPPPPTPIPTPAPPNRSLPDLRGLSAAIWAVNGVLLLALVGIGVLLRRGARWRRGQVVTWIGGVRQTSALSDLRGVGPRAGSVELAALLARAPAGALGWTLSWRWSGAAVRPPGEAGPRVDLEPDVPARVPLSDSPACWVLWHPGGGSDDWTPPDQPHTAAPPPQAEPRRAADPLGGPGRGCSRRT